MRSSRRPQSGAHQRPPPPITEQVRSHSTDPTRTRNLIRTGRAARVGASTSTGSPVRRSVQRPSSQPESAARVRGPGDRRVRDAAVASKRHRHMAPSNDVLAFPRGGSLTLRVLGGRWPTDSQERKRGQQRKSVLPWTSSDSPAFARASTTAPTGEGRADGIARASSSAWSCISILTSAFARSDTTS